MNNEPSNDEEEPDVRFTYANERTTSPLTDAPLSSPLVSG